MVRVMARKPRIEYAGAIYHVMSRGDRGGAIFRDKLDYDHFLTATREVCERTGWRIHAWVLLENHFHWLLETPIANLVSGMKWFLGTYSQRFNTRHGQHGHVFQGRYKAVVIESGSGGYFEIVSTYIHLNPGRAGLLTDPGIGLIQYPWSSYGQYLKTSTSRPAWLRVDRVLGNLELRDDASGRRQYAQYMEARVSALHTAAGKREYKQLWDPLRHGWFVGSDTFGETLLEYVKDLVNAHDRCSYGGDAVRRHDEREAEAWIQAGLRALNLTEADLPTLPKGHPHKCILAQVAHSRTVVSHKWLAERLHMGHPQSLSAYIKRVPSDAKVLMRLRVNAIPTKIHKYED